MTDKLEEIITKQTAFMDKLGVPRVAHSLHGLNGDDVQKFIPQIMFALVCELGEIGDEINWKHWKKSKKTINTSNLRMELVDAFHFLLEIMIMCGMNADSIHNEYMKKMEENLRRQQDGY